jgi:hypothetical protein
MIQIIVYSERTGRVRRVIDPQGEVADAEAYRAAISLTPGEASIVRVKRGVYRLNRGEPVSLDTLPYWQAHISAHTGITPADDRYCSVDSSGVVVAVHIADPACGDTSPHDGCQLVQHATAHVGDKV